MTQKELIEFCKENDPSFNKEASFKVLEPFWKKNAIGITEAEWKRGFYVCIDGKGKSSSHDGEVYYFTFSNLPKVPMVNDLYDTHYKKFFINLERLGYWGEEIVKEETLFQVKNEDLVDKPTVFPIPEVSIKEMIPNLVEEFPIQKIHMQTMYKSEKTETSIIVSKSSVEGRMQLFISDEIDLLTEDDYFKFSFTKEQFSDLVDLMIEARKDLLK